MPDDIFVSLESGGDLVVMVGGICYELVGESTELPTVSSVDATFSDCESCPGSSQGSSGHSSSGQSSGSPSSGSQSSGQESSGDEPHFCIFTWSYQYNCLTQSTLGPYYGGEVCRVPPSSVNTWVKVIDDGIICEWIYYQQGDSCVIGEAPCVPDGEPETEPDASDCDCGTTTSTSSSSSGAGGSSSSSSSSSADDSSGNSSDHGSSEEGSGGGNPLP